MAWTTEQLNEKLKANASLGRKNGHINSQVRADNPKPSQGSTLVGVSPGEDSRWYGSARCFEITFTIYSTNPCDYDGYSIKEMQDMVVRAGIIPDDKWSVLSGRTVSRKAHTKEEERTEIEITALTSQDC